jgi:hypothetical protein
MKMAREGNDLTLKWVIRMDIGIYIIAVWLGASLVHLLNYQSQKPITKAKEKSVILFEDEIQSKTNQK